jgi:hypothetical protein
LTQGSLLFILQILRESVCIKMIYGVMILPFFSVTLNSVVEGIVSFCLKDPMPLPWEAQVSRSRSLEKDKFFFSHKSPLNPFSMPVDRREVRMTTSITEKDTLLLNRKKYLFFH